MKIKSYLWSFLILLIYSLLIVLLPNFGLYVAFRGCIFPVLISILLTVLNIHTVKNVLGYVVKLLIFIICGYLLRWFTFYAFKGYFDVDFRYLKNDWYVLYIYMQIPIIVVSSVLTFIISKCIRKRK